MLDPAYRINAVASLAVGDIDGDGLPEIVAVATSGDKLIAFEHDGTFKWRSSTVEFLGSPAITLADLNGDGTVEIIFGRQVLDAAGTLLWTGAGGRGGNLSAPGSRLLRISTWMGFRKSSGEIPPSLRRVRYVGSLLCLMATRQSVISTMMPSRNRGDQRWCLSA